MKSLLTIFSIAMVLAGAPSSSYGQDTIKFGIAEEPNPPFTVKDASGAWTGWEADIRDAICKQMNATCEWVDTSWDDLIPALKAKKFDIIWSSLPITDDRRKSIDFTDKYYDTPNTLAGVKELLAKNGLLGKVIGVQAATMHLTYANAHFKSLAKEIRTYPTQDDANQDLAAGHIDAVMADAITIQAFLDTDAGKACCKLLGAADKDPKILGQGFAGGVRKEDAALRGQINAAIKAIRASGEYDAITKKYFAFDIYGG